MPFPMAAFGLVIAPSRGMKQSVSEWYVEPRKIGD